MTIYVINGWTPDVGIWLDADIDPDVPLIVIQKLEEIYNICVKEID